MRVVGVSIIGGLGTFLSYQAEVMRATFRLLSLRTFVDVS